MQSKEQLLKDTRKPVRFANHTNLPHPELLLTKENLSHSEEDTKVSDHEESESEMTQIVAAIGGGRSNAELEDYREEIRLYVMGREQMYMVDHGYLRHHRMVNLKMRSYLVKHIFRISQRFDLLRTTTYLAVQYMDLYFSRVFAFKDQLEPVAVMQACLFMAMKYEEIYPPELTDWVDRRHKDQIILLEADILRALDFQLAHYTLEHFLHFALWQDTRPDTTEPLPAPSDRTLLFMDLSLFDLPMRQFRPSQLAHCLHVMGQKGGREAADGMDRMMVQNVSWMIERNSDSLNWLLSNKYCGVNALFAWHVFYIITTATLLIDGRYEGISHLKDFLYNSSNV